GVLVGFATLARGLLPPEAVLGRLGGEEFACLLPDRSLDEAAAAAGRGRLAMAEIARAQRPGLALGVSVGVAQRPRGRR
ncbi:diguanylate cyclase domain-containing protein, partial [Klebsiella aerogenes]|uniref:diguanylate cyclase domain-containing protein n=1 Tax=Klebsiella aerogenes TaxID=548 RepID=UPI0013D5553A